MYCSGTFGNRKFDAASDPITYYIPASHRLPAVIIGNTCGMYCSGTFGNRKFNAASDSITYYIPAAHGSLL